MNQIIDENMRLIQKSGIPMLASTFTLWRKLLYNQAKIQSQNTNQNFSEFNQIFINVIDQKVLSLKFIPLLKQIYKNKLVNENNSQLLQVQYKSELFQQFEKDYGESKSYLRLIDEYIEYLLNLELCDDLISRIQLYQIIQKPASLTDNSNCTDLDFTLNDHQRELYEALNQDLKYDHFSKTHSYLSKSYQAFVNLTFDTSLYVLEKLSTCMTVIGTVDIIQNIMIKIAFGFYITHPGIILGTFIGAAFLKYSSCQAISRAQVMSQIECVRRDLKSINQEIKTKRESIEQLIGQYFECKGTDNQNEVLEKILCGVSVLIKGAICNKMTFNEKDQDLSFLDKLYRQEIVENKEWVNIVKNKQ
eukprot:403357217